MKSLIVFLSLSALLACAGCTGDAEQQTRDTLERQAERYEELLRDRETRYLKSTVDGMTKLLFLEAERTRNTEKLTSLALKLEDRMERFGDGVRALSLELKYYADPKFTPFIAVWSQDGGEFQRIVKGDAVIPEAARKGLSVHEQEVTFTDGAQDERRIKVRLYYSDEGLAQSIRDIRE